MLRLNPAVVLLLAAGVQSGTEVAKQEPMDLFFLLDLLSEARILFW